MQILSFILFRAVTRRYTFLTWDKAYIHTGYNANALSAAKNLLSPTKTGRELNGKRYITSTRKTLGLRIPFSASSKVRPDVDSGFPDCQKMIEIMMDNMV